MAKPGSSRPPAAGESDLMGSMAKRLAALEKKCKDQTEEISRLKADNAVTAAKLDVAERALVEGGGDDGNDANDGAPAAPANFAEIVAHHEAEAERLRRSRSRAWREVEAMRAFLQDYGLVWVGDREGGASDSPAPGPRAQQRPADGGRAPKPPAAPMQPSGPGSRRPSAAGSAASNAQSASERPDSGAARRSGDAAAEAPLPPVRTGPGRPASPAIGKSPVPFSVRDLGRKIVELNKRAEDGRTVQTAAGERRKLHDEPVKLMVFADGLKLHTNIFQSWGHPVTRAVVADIWEGYFPFTLKDDFPDGIDIEMVDHSSTPHEAWLQAQRDSAGPCNVRSLLEMRRSTSGGRPAPPPPRESREAFLSKLPAAVIRDGKIINVRDDIGGMLAKPAAEVAMLPSEAEALLSDTQRQSAGPSVEPSANSNAVSAVHASGENVQISTLQIKREDGGMTYRIRLQFKDTIRDLRRALDDYRRNQPEFAGTNYVIRSTFPARAYDNPEETLEEAGLVPNATLFLRSS